MINMFFILSYFLNQLFQFLLFLLISFRHEIAFDMFGVILLLTNHCGFYLFLVYLWVLVRNQTVKFTSVWLLLSDQLRLVLSQLSLLLP